MLHARDKQTRRWAALSEHQHARMRLCMQCMNALILCVWPDHACLSLGQEACSVHKQAVMLRTPGSPRSSRRRPCTLVERLAAVRVVAQQADRQSQLGKADGRRVGRELEIASKVVDPSQPELGSRVRPPRGYPAGLSHGEACPVEDRGCFVT